MTKKLALLGLIACITPTMLHAQEGPESQQASAPAAEDHNQDADFEVEGVTVTANRTPRGAVLGDIPPEQTYTAADVRSFGVSSVSDLLTELAPQTSSGRGGSPVVLLNGRRISSFAEIRDIPTEAITRVEILPEEVALKYGYSSDQKVVNIVLRPRFRATTLEADASMPTAGGQVTGELEGGRLQINNAGRLNLAASYKHSDDLLESDRDLSGSASLYGLSGNVASPTSGAQIDPALSALAGTPVTIAAVPASALTGAPTLAAFLPTANVSDSGDTSQYRSLRPATDEVTVNAVINRTIFGKVSATGNAGGSYSQSTSLLGLAQTRLLIPTGDAFSPFGQDVALYRYRGDLGSLEQVSRDYTGHLGFTLDSDAKGWRWSLTGAYDHATDRTQTDRGIDSTALQDRLDALDPTFNPFGALPRASFLTDRARSTSNTANLQLVLNGALFHVPAGDLSTTFKVGAEAAGLASESERSGVVTDTSLWRGSQNAQVSFDLPIASRKNDVLQPLGDLSANLNLAVNNLSDFGALTTVGYGLTWTPVKPVSFIVSMTHQDTAPSMQQLGAPSVSTPDVRVFDFVRGETVEVTRISGGNPDLEAEERQALKVGVTFKPPKITGLSINANYFRVRTDNPIASFPAAVTSVEAAFPSRFVRDVDGDLIRIDSRPVNFERQESDQFRWGFNYSRQIGKTPPRPERGEGGRDWRQRESGEGRERPPGEAPGQAPAAASGQAPKPAQAEPSDRPPGAELLQGALAQGGERPPAQPEPTPSTAAGTGGQNRPSGPGGWGGPGGPGGGPGGGRGFGGPPGGGAARLQVSLNHTIHLREQVLLGDGSPALDLLDGDALSSGGGQPRHEVSAQAGLTKGWLGARASADWHSAVDVKGTMPGGTGDLHFSDLTTVNLRLFANVGAKREWVTAHPFLRGTRVTLSVNNLFDSRTTVRDAAGLTPINYQPDYLDPLGRTVRLSLRKLIF